MKHTVKGLLVYETANWLGNDERVNFQTCEPWSTQEAVLICPYEFDVEVPDSFDPRPEQIAALKKTKRKAEADFEAMCTDINRQISQLQAIEHSVSV